MATTPHHTQQHARTEKSTQPSRKAALKEKGKEFEKTLEICQREIKSCLFMYVHQQGKVLRFRKEKVWDACQHYLKNQTDF